MEKLLTLQEVSQLLGSDDPKGRKVRNLWKAGYLDGAKFGKRIMFRETSVKEYVEHQFRLQQFK